MRTSLQTILILKEKTNTEHNVFDRTAKIQYTFGVSCRPDADAGQPANNCKEVEKFSRYEGTRVVGI
jgi:hypothetical protein